MIMRSELAIVRGGGDLATGIIYRLRRVGYRVLCLETQYPLVVRRTVSAAQAVFDGACEVEGMRAVLVDDPGGWDGGTVAVKVDPDGTCIAEMSPALVVDAIMAKRFTGTNREMAPLVLAIGPGFSAPDQVHGVVETKRGHYLGRLITDGSAIPNNGIPGMEMGYSIERLLRAPADGYVTPLKGIGELVEAGEVLAKIGGEEIRSQIAGVLRGMIHPSVRVTAGLKIGDVDPRGERKYCFSITDKAMAIAGGVLEAVMAHERRFSQVRHSTGPSWKRSA